MRGVADWTSSCKLDAARRSRALRGAALLAAVLLIPGVVSAQGFDIDTRQLAVFRNGTGAGQTGEVRFYELVVNGSHYNYLKAKDSLAATVGWSLPDADGVSGECVKTDGAGSLYFDVCGGGGASLPAADTTSLVEGSADGTKEVRIEADGLTTATTRVWTAQDADLTVAGIDLAQTWTAQQTFDAITLFDGEIRILESGGSNYVGLASPLLSSNYTYTWPALDGTNGQALTTNGAGLMSWATVATIAGSNHQVQWNDAGAFGAQSEFLYDDATGHLTLRDPDDNDRELRFEFGNSGFDGGALLFFDDQAGNTDISFGVTASGARLLLSDGATELVDLFEEADGGQIEVMNDSGAVRARIDTGLFGNDGTFELFTSSTTGVKMQAGSGSTAGFYVLGSKIIGVREAAISNPASTTTANNSAIISILNAMRNHGLISP